MSHQMQPPIRPEFRLAHLPDGSAVMVMYHRTQPVAYRPLWRARQGRVVMPIARPANDR